MICLYRMMICLYRINTFRIEQIFVKDSFGIIFGLIYAAFLVMLGIIPPIPIAEVLQNHHKSVFFEVFGVKVWMFSFYEHQWF